MASSTQRDSSSLPPPSRWKYDVFLSFRGETRKTFTAHLRKELLDQGITETFLDETELQEGKPISELFSAIAQSRFAILVISQDYASSTWCLNELLKIFECMEGRGAILPIFYSVECSDVGKQSGSFEQAFTKLEERFKHDINKVKSWRDALRTVAKIKGWTTKDRYEPQLIREIVDKVRTLVRPTWSEPEEKLVGIDSTLEDLHRLLDTDTESVDVRFIGIWGLSGIGKTTIAERAYARILHKFERSCFLDRVSDKVSRTDGLKNLKRELCKSLMKRNIEDWAFDIKGTIKRLLCRKKVLLVLDDVDDNSQLEELCGNQDGFAPGSRVIITARSERLLSRHGVDRRFEVHKLNDQDSLQLFSLKAFGRDYPDKHYVALSKCFVIYANGLPLALKLWGSSLHKADQDEWRSKLGKLKDNFDGKIMNRLKIDFHGLDEEEKSIFLDIACFFTGKYKDEVVERLRGFRSRVDNAIKVLITWSLITVSDNMVWMPNLLQEMGRAIVREESKEPGERSRLWLSEDIFYVLRNNTGTSAVEGIVLDHRESEVCECHPEAFSKMFNLKFIKLHNMYLHKGLACLPNSLQFLEWKGYPLDSLPLGFKPDKLVELSMCHSRIEQLWSGIKDFDKLKVIKLSHSKSLTSTPNFEEVQNLERLDLEGCESLVEIDSSIRVLKKLIFLNLKDCKSLESLPGEIAMEYLEILILSGCSNVKRIPEFVGHMENLWKISLDETAIEDIPSSIEGLTKLSVLDIRDCVNLTHLPSTIGNLKFLKSLNASGCTQLAELTASFQELVSLEKLDLSGTAIEKWPFSVLHLKKLKSFIFHGPKGRSPQPWHVSLPFRWPLKSLQPMSQFLPPLSGLCSLRELDLSDHNLRDGTILADIGCLSSLVSLNLSGNDFVKLPESISQLSQLENLYLSGCRSLEYLPLLSSSKSLQVTANGCTSLERLQHPLNLDTLNSSCFNLMNCFGLVEKESHDHKTFTMLRKYLQRISYPGDRFEIVIPGSKIPWWFSRQRVGSSVSIQVTPNWCDNKWMGYALCAVFQVFSSGWELSCVLDVNGQKEYPAPVLSTDVQPVSDHLWLFYVSRDITFGTEWQKGCDRLTFSFESSGPSMVKKCGARLIYEQDVEEFNKVVTQSSSSISP
ncbi:PREDICTED: TMV resistance protein N-like isoform X2 [Prunus mume]|nr:PREDICTED: TMV resistance protein N-like isoform X2 [Prunus mume]XP_008231888.1 PREDICTED: TMV resistance protein N-like isoform X2 [Prunus mume]XP_008231889.1 PREDICTED: TMV resistance protein N-like isoform X2 [Prunus mume]